MKITHRKINAAKEVEASYNRIDLLESQISELEDSINDAKMGGADPEDLIDAELELERLKQELNFAWQDDEAEYNYALQQQEFNPDGSLKGYPAEASTDVKADEDFVVDYDLNQMSNDWWEKEEKKRIARELADEADAEESDIYASDIIPNKQIQEGMEFNQDGHRFEITSIAPDRKTCTVTEDWINEDTGADEHREYTYNIEQDSESGEYIYNTKYEEYAKPGQDDYSWWARKYAAGADNYPWSWDDIADEDKHDFDYMGYSVLYSPDQDVFRIDSYLGNSIDIGFDFEDKESAMQWIDKQNPDDEYTPSATAGDYSPSNPWDAPGMSISDFI